MRKAAGLWRLSVALGVFAAGAIALGAMAAMRALDVDVAALGTLMEICSRYVIPDSSSVAVAVLGSVSVAVVVLALRRIVRERRALRRFEREVPAVAATRVAGAEIVVVADAVPRAYCSGWLQPKIHVSTGALSCLDDEELRAVVAHEAHHAERRDPLRLLVVKALGDALFFMPVFRRIAERYATLAELAADDAAVTASGGPQPLASALLRFGETRVPGVVVGIAPERVDHLLGARPAWELPVSLVAGGVVTITGLAVLAAGTASAVPAGAVSGSVLAAQACMVGMTLGPIVVGATLLIVLTRRLRRG